MAAQLEAYSISIEGHDLRDIERAVTKLIRGEVPGHNPSFAPSASMLGATVRMCMDSRLDAERRAAPYLPPPPPPERTPEERARVRALVKQATERLGSAPLPWTVGNDAEDAA